MPGYKGHIVGATAAAGFYVGGLALAPESIIKTQNPVVSDPQLLFLIFVTAILFGLFPDVDTNSKGQDLFYLVAFIVDIVLIYNDQLAAAAFLGLLAMLPILGHHRGWTHSRAAMFLIPLPILVVPYMYSPRFSGFAACLYGAAVIGYFSHLLLDGKITRYVHVKGSRQAYST